MESIFTLGMILQIVDKVSGPATKIGRSLDAVRSKARDLGPTFDKFKSYGLKVAAGGTLMIALLSGTVMATADTQRALGELSSVGIRNLAALETAGMQFSNTWAGTTKAQFIAAAYDIKSGISSLSDTGVAEFTKLAALTGKATKSTTAEMTSLFATGYGIYKDMYADLTDLQFGEVFSAGIAASVQAFKTTGSGMAQAISTLGAAATTANRPLEEQLAVLGMLQATMTGSEAGTKYKALMQAAAQAGDRLGISFVDANNQLLSMPEIITKLRETYGETLDAMEKTQIQKAFGTQEAVAVIDLLYGKVGNLTDNIRTLSGAMNRGAGFTEKMALAMNMDIGSGIKLLWQQWHNLVEVIGKQFIPILTPLFTRIGLIITATTRFAERHATLTRVIVLVVGAAAVLAVALGGLAVAVGAVGIVMSSTLIPTLTAAIAAVWGFTAALLANPITWVVVAIVALGAALVVLYRKCASVRTVIDGFLYVLGYLAGAAVRVGRTVAQAIASPLQAVGALFRMEKAAVENLLGWIAGIVPRFLEAGRGLWNALTAGIASVITKPVDAVKKGLTMVRNLLPFSDAKEGPLSQLTLSGSRIMETLGAGARAAMPVLKQAVAGALAGAMVMVPPINADLTARPDVRSEITRVETERTGEKRITIKNLTVTLPNVSDGRSFMEELQRFVEAYDG